jgi:lipopolysaccharide/colanic/teichoic acid biosynthesis glycosyltransferase
MRRTTVQKAWPPDSKRKPPEPIAQRVEEPRVEREPRLVLDVDSLAKQISRSLKRDDHIMLALGTIIVICLIIIIVLLALNLSR